MKVVVDRARCCSYGSCAEAVPSVFSFDDQGDLVIAAEIPEDLRAKVAFACEACPAAALTALDDRPAPG